MPNLTVSIGGAADTAVVPHVRSASSSGGATASGAASTLALPHRRTVTGVGGLTTGGAAFLRVILRRVGSGGATLSGAATVAFVDRNRYEFDPA